MRTLLFTAIIPLFLLTQCTDPSFAKPEKYFNKDLVHLGIYVELLPDPTLNLDEQCWQQHELRLRSRAGYEISFYKVLAPPSGESVERSGITNREGNYNAYDMIPATYHIIAMDENGYTQEAIVTPAKGEETRITFSFY
jgi:hypothetical protein